eukprot:6934474-Ditylum_brightwellii.AAC.1
MPQHRAMKELVMTRDHFLFMWHNFHVYNEEYTDVQGEQKEGEADKDDDADDDCILELMMERDAASDEESSIEKEEGETCGECKDDSSSEKKMW